MDGFYLAFVAVGMGLFWLSVRRKQAASGALLAGWVLLGAALCCGGAYFAALSLARSHDSFLWVVAILEVLRHVLLGAATLCVGLSFAMPGEKRRIIPEAEVPTRSESLNALTSRPASGRM
jgi:hypothetical protein